MGECKPIHFITYPLICKLRLELNVGTIVASMPALRQLLSIFNQRDKHRPRLAGKSPQRKRTLDTNGPRTKDSIDQAHSSDKSDESISGGSSRRDTENGILVPRRMSMAPRIAGLGSAGRNSREEKLEQDLLHHEDEKLSPRETPWATPRVSPRMGSFGTPPWLEYGE